MGAMVLSLSKNQFLAQYEPYVAGLKISPSSHRSFCIPIRQVRCCNLQLHHWSNAKPAAMIDDAILGQMTRGRPPKRTSSSDVGHTIDASEAANEQQTKNRNKSKQAVIPTTGSAEPTDTTAHATSNKVWCKPITGAPPIPAFAWPQRSTRNPAPNYLDSIWSATAAQLAAIQLSINHGHETRSP